MKILPAQVNKLLNSPDIGQYSGLLIYGPDESVVNIRAKTVINNFKTRNTNIVYVTKDEIKSNPGILLEEFQAIPFFNPNNVIVLQLNERPNDYTRYVQEVFSQDLSNNKNFLIIIAHDLTSSSSLKKFAETSNLIGSIACYEENATSVTNYISKQLQDLNFKFDKDVVDYLHNNIGNNLLVLNSEIQKLDLYKGQDRNLTLQDLPLIISNSAENSISDFVNAFCYLKNNETFLFLEKLLQNNHPLILIRSLITYFLQLQRICFKLENGTSLEQIIKEEKIFWQQIETTKAHTKIWNIKMVNLMLSKLIDLEKSTKFSSSTIEMQNFILKSLLFLNRHLNKSK